MDRSFIYILVNNNLPSHIFESKSLSCSVFPLLLLPRVVIATQQLASKKKIILLSKVVFACFVTWMKYRYWLIIKKLSFYTKLLHKILYNYITPNFFKELYSA